MASPPSMPFPPGLPPDDETCTGWSCDNIPAAIGVSLGAGLATAVGGALVFFPQFIRAVPQSVILGVSLALSAGVMLYVSFIEIFYKSLEEIESEYDPDEYPGAAAAITTTCFFSGIVICILLEVAVHYAARKLGAEGGAAVLCAAHDHGGVAHMHSHADLLPGGAEHSSEDAEGAPATSTREVKAEPAAEADVELAQVKVAADGGGAKAAPAKAGDIDAAEQKVLSRMGVMTALAIGVHNFPEGLATFIATVDDVSSGAALGVAIAIHNIPEGLCVAMPIFYATGNKWKAFAWSLVSGITEPIGGLAGYAALQPAFTPLVYGIVFSMVGGMMVFIVCHELLPSAHRYMGSTNKATGWFLAGMAVMALSLVLFSL